MTRMLSSAAIACVLVVGCSSALPGPQSGSATPAPTTVPPSVAPSADGASADPAPTTVATSATPPAIEPALPPGLEPRPNLPPLEDGEVAACIDLCGSPPIYGRVTPGAMPAGRYQTEWFFGGYMTLELGPGWSSLEDSTAELQLFPPGESEYGLHFGLDLHPVAEGGERLTAFPRTVSDLIGWLAANPELEVSEPQDTTIGELPAMSVDVALSDEATNDAPDCPDPVCVLFIGDDQIDHTGGIAGDDVYRFYLADVEYSDSRHLFSVMIEGRDRQHLDAVVPVVEAVLDTVVVPAAPVPSPRTAP